MSTPNSNEKSISKLQDEAVNGDGILGGGKSMPVITVDINNDTPIDVAIPGGVSLIDNVDYANDGNLKPIDGPAAIS